MNVCMMCLTGFVGDEALRMMPFQMGDPNQQWERDVQQGYIRCRQNHNRVLDIFSQSAAYNFICFMF